MAGPVDDVRRLAADLRKLMAKANPLPWALDTEPNEDGEYGPGPDPSCSYDDFMILGSQGGKILGTENATHKLIEEDGPDEDGYVNAWDQYGKGNGDLVVGGLNALPWLVGIIEILTDRDDLVDIVRPACLTNDQAGQVANRILAEIAKAIPSPKDREQADG